MPSAWLGRGARFHGASAAPWPACTRRSPRRSSARQPSRRWGRLGSVFQRRDGQCGWRPELRHRPRPFREARRLDRRCMGRGKAGGHERGRQGGAPARTREGPRQRQAQHGDARVQHPGQPEVVGHRRGQALAAESAINTWTTARRAPRPAPRQRQARPPAHERDHDGAGQFTTRCAALPCTQAHVHSRQGSRSPSAACQSSACASGRSPTPSRCPRRAPSRRRAQAQQRAQQGPGRAIGAERAPHAPGPNTARHSARPAARSGASVSSANSVGCSSRRARCCARRSSR